MMRKGILLVSTSVAFVCQLGLCGCEKSRTTKGNTAMEPHSDVIGDLRAFWDRECAQVNPENKDAPATKVGLLEGAIKSLPGDLRDRVAEYVTTTAPEDSRSDFFSYLVQALITVQVEEADREGLSESLSAACPPKIGMTDVEFYVVTQAPRQLQDAILVFTDAFVEAKATAPRNTILHAMERAFRGLVPQEGDTSAFVAECAAWYRANRSELSVNPDYAYNLDLYYGKELPLFQKRSSGD